MRRDWVWIFCTVLGGLFGGGYAQSVSGVLTDESGAVLPGVSVDVIHTETNSARNAVTDDQGRYRITNLPVGKYEVRASLAGFRTARRVGINLTVGEDAVVNLEMVIGELSEQVTVTGEAPLVDLSGATMSGLVGEREMRDLPLNGRSFDQLITLESAAAYYRLADTGSTQGFGTKFTISGQRWESNRIYQDGTEVVGASKASDVPGSAAGLQLGVDAIREFRVLTNNYSAEFGKKVGGHIITVTKSGTNEIHGSVFAFHRNDNLDARNFFDPGDNPPEFKRNNFGFSVGGPIKKDSLFIFGNYEGLRERLGLTNIAIVPDANARRGLLPDPRTGALVQRPVAPSVVPYLSLWPLPNGRNFGDGTAEAFSSPSRPIDEDYLTTRFDYNASNSDSFFASYSLDDANKDQPLVNPFFTEVSRTRTQTATLEEKHIFSPTLLHIARFGFNRSFFNLDTIAAIDINPGLSFHPGLGFGQLDFRTGVTNVGSTQGPNWVANNSYQLTEQIGYAAGSHSLSMGWQIQRLHKNEDSVDFKRGTFRFFSLDEFIAGRPERFRGAVPPGVGGVLNVGVATDPNPVKGWRLTYGGFYVQDKWSVTKKLNFDVGLRYEFTTVPKEVNGRSSMFVLDRVTPEARFMRTTPVVGKPIFENHSRRSFAPRLAFAWDPMGDGRTAVRAGFGVFYEQLDNIFRFYTHINPPFSTRADFSTLSFPRPFVGLDVSQIRVTARTIDPNIEPATVFHYNLGVQRELFADMVLKMSYVGSHGYHLSQSPGVNHRPADILPDGRKFFPANRPFANPVLGPMEMLMSNINSWYNALNVAVEKRFGGGTGRVSGLRLKWAYTFAKSMDDNSTNMNTQGTNQRDSMLDPLNVKMNRALSAFDIRHNGSFNFSYDLPKAASGRVAGAFFNDWSTNGIVSANTGYPVTILAGFNVSRTGEESVADRPDLLSGASNNPVLGGPDRYFDPLVFVLPQAGFFGNLGRNTLSGPGLVTFDFSLVKNIPISEKRRVQLRAEFFNFFNRANFGLPLQTLFDSSGRRVGAAGRITDTVTTSRQVQLGLRFEF